MKKGIDVCFTVDSTGSMYPCLTQVRRKVSEVSSRLLADIPDLRIAIIVHGDYCDAGSTYVTKSLDFTRDIRKIENFVFGVGPTDGGDRPECYELVLQEARKLDWRAGKSKVLAVIGDDVPHTPDYYLNRNKINWRNELGLLKEAGISVYGIHAMPGIRQHSKAFYQELATAGGYYLTLDQFSTVVDLIYAICYKQSGASQLDAFEREVRQDGRYSRNMADVFAQFSGRKAKVERPASGLIPVPAGRFQTLAVERKQSIKDFVLEQGCNFKVGRGFYELTKTETVQGNKEIVLLDKCTGDIFTGAKVREMLSLPPQTDKNSPRRVDAKIGFKFFEKFRVFVQSTSHNRVLMPATRLLYEVEDWEV